MTCHRIVSGKKVVGFLCDGRGKPEIMHALCPWCCVRGKTYRDRKVHCLATPIHEGYCGLDMVCGRCGQAWNTSDYGAWFPLPVMTIPEREANIKRVKAFARRKR
jgi:hypothetical protein